jgi:hypothetical protein
MRRTLLLLISAVLLAPAAAHAAGGPVVGLDGSSGVVTPDGAYRIVTFLGGNHTVVARVRVHDGTIARYRTIPGRYSVPAVAYDSSASGLSADGRTLVLIRPRYQVTQKRTHLLVLSAGRLLQTRSIVLRGDFSFDAISPDGSKMFLVQYAALSRHGFDPTDYAVRQLDVRSGKLAAAPVVDPREPDEKMGGIPVTRAVSPDGRWAYTLYSADKPFVHALDTVHGSARCIDLDSLAKRNDIFQLKLLVPRDGRRIQVMDGARPVLQVDAASFAVSQPHTPDATVATDSPPATHDGNAPRWPFALAALLVVLIAVASARPLARATRGR